MITMHIRAGPFYEDNDDHDDMLTTIHIRAGPFDQDNEDNLEIGMIRLVMMTTSMCVRNYRRYL